MVQSTRKPKLAVWKFASCDGCQLSLLDCEDELLSVADAIEIANFPEASRAITKGPYDISLVEGSITTPHDAQRIQSVRKQSKFLIAIGTARPPAAFRRSATIRMWLSLPRLFMPRRLTSRRSLNRHRFPRMCRSTLSYVAARSTSNSSWMF